MFVLLGTDPKELKAGTQTDTCTGMFTAAWFSAAKGRSNMCGSMDEQNVVHPHSGMLFSLIKEGDSDTCYHMNEP